MSLEESVRDKITEAIASNSTVLFMKGNRTQPQCGFSATVIQILEQLGCDYSTIDVLSDAEIREGIKVFSNWPTIPQLYIDGEFLGGCDIVKDMHASGDLGKKLQVDISDLTPPTITITDAAASALQKTLSDGDGQALHLDVDGTFNTSLQLELPSTQKVTATSNGITLYIPAGAIKRAEGMTIDFLDGPEGSGFKIENPNAPPPVHQMEVTALKDLLNGDSSLRLLDCRTPEERATANIEGSIHLDEGTARDLTALEKEAMLVFHCHHGGRSQRAAEYFRDQGFRNVHNLVGGIDAWSQEIDSSVPRY
jgi:monothiol glutaredoxin